MRAKAVDSLLRSKSFASNLPIFGKMLPTIFGLSMNPLVSRQQAGQRARRI
jgi:hypothetical protein